MNLILKNNSLLSKIKRKNLQSKINPLLFLQNENILKKIDENNVKIDQNNVVLDKVLDIVTSKKNKEKIIRKRLPLRKPIFKKHFERFFNMAGVGSKNSLKPIKLKLIYFLLYYLGVRANEVRLLTYEMLLELKNTGECQIYSSKTNSQLCKVLPSEGIELLRGEFWNDIEVHFKVYQYIGSSTYQNKTYHPVAFIKFINRDLKNICNLYKMPVFTSHSFRVGLITALLKKFRIQDVSSEIGHKNIQSTMLYFRYRISNLKTIKKRDLVFKNR